MHTDDYEVSLELLAPALSEQQIEDLLVRLVDLLTEEASELALGATGAIDGSVLELLFTVQAVDMADLYAKLRDVAVILRDSAGLDLASTTTRRGDRELAFA